VGSKFRIKFGGKCMSCPHARSGGRIRAMVAKSRAIGEALSEGIKRSLVS